MQKTAFFAKTLLLNIFVRQNFSWIGPCESSRPGDSENVVLFERATFLTGVIAAQSRNMSAKLKASPQIGGVKKKSRPQFLEFLKILASDPKKYSLLGSDARIFKNSKNCGRDFFSINFFFEFRPDFRSQ